MRKVIRCIAFTLFIRSYTMAQSIYPTIGAIERINPKLDQLLAKDAKIEVLASGFVWAEGPVWVKDQGNGAGSFLLFSDVPQNKIFKWTAKDGCTPFLEPSGYTGLMAYGDEPGSNGLTLDRQGRLIACEHGDRRVSALPLDNAGGKKTLADNYMGKRFNSPNDVVVHSSGAVYFTDPPYGLPKKEKDPSRETDVCGVYRIAPTANATAGQVTLLVRDLSRPNGLAFSPDEKTLYVGNSDPANPVIMAYPVQADGSLGKGWVFYDAREGLKHNLERAPDGLKVDKAGNVWSSGPGGIVIIAPNGGQSGPGRLLGRLRTEEKSSNCAWGDDGSTLYITVDMYLCRVKTLTTGVGF